MMENSKHIDSPKRKSPEEFPSLIKFIASNIMEGFDTVKENNNNSLTLGTESSGVQSQSHEEFNLRNPHRTHSVSISVPSSPKGSGLRTPKKVLFNVDENGNAFGNGTPDSSSSNVSKTTGGEKKPVYSKCYSQPIPKGIEVEVDELGNKMNFVRHPSKLNKLKDKRYDSFKTFSGKLSREGEPVDDGKKDDGRKKKSENEALPVHRYFDALEGPELDTLKDSEELVLPNDKTWPFLLRFPISSFGICLGVSSQAIMWKTLANTPSTKFLHISPIVNMVLWGISVLVVAIIFFIYLLKVIFYFEAVRREYYHPIRVNFFFAPWIALLFLALGLPNQISKTLHPSLFYILMFPIFCFELKIYGQWMSGGQRRLSKVANPSNHLSVVGNFVGALLGAAMGLKEGPIFFFAVGLAHYTVLFVTLYQRLPTNATLPKELHPVFFLFVAAPSVASLAWAKIHNDYDTGSKIAYFIAMFLYFSLAVRIDFFRGFKFSLAWWAYTFPMTGAAIATIRYSNEVTNIVSKSLVVVLSLTATITVTALLITTILHAFVMRDLFPNDIAIAISEHKKHHHHHSYMKWLHLKHGSWNEKEFEKVVEGSTVGHSDDIEAGPKPPGTSEAKESED